jgi:putative ABC transport system permease protein
MLKNNLRIALRNLWKNKSLTFINIFGLAAGMACSLLIFLFVRDELSYDRFNAGSDQIYRVVKDFVNDDGSRLPDATTPAALAPAIQRAIPEVEHVTRVFPGWGDKFMMTYGDRQFVEDRLFRADSSFFDVFSIPFLQGKPASAFTQLNSILLTESMAKKYFGNADPMGKVIHSDVLGEMMVSGVLRDIPANAHFHFDFLISVRKFSGSVDDRWGWYNFYTYIKLKPHTQIATVDPKIQALYKKNNPEGKNLFYSQPLDAIHLDSDLKWEIEPNSNRLYTYVFTIIGVFVILIGCINYVNLATAKSAMRAKEIGVRKVSGAFKGSLIKQFLTESVLTVFCAFLFALLLAQLLLAPVNELTQKQLSMSSLASPGMLLIILATIVMIGLAAGIYPAWYLSSFKPALVLKGISASERNIFHLRKILVVSQFTISVGLIIGTLIVIQQIHFIQRAKLGLNKDQVMIVSDAERLSRGDRESILNNLKAIPGVRDAATANGLIGGLNWTTEMKLKGSKNGQLVNFLGISHRFLNVLGIQIKEGRNFSILFPSDSLSLGIPGTRERFAGGVILNEKAVHDLGIPDPVIGQMVSWTENRDTTWYLKVVGVAHDFHFASFKSEIKPFAFVIGNYWQNNYTVKLSSTDIKGTIGSIEKLWKKYAPDRPFQYSFLDETFAGLYKSEERFNTVFLYITILAIVIACMGLFGLTAFMVDRRTKEIGIRKVVGASVSNIVALLSKDFVALVLTAFVLACPVAWFCMNRWLQNFVYRIHINAWVFVAAGGMAICIALATISFQAIKAAMANPVRSLRSE